jgi:hypothetical protein
LRFTVLGLGALAVRLDIPIPFRVGGEPKPILAGFRPPRNENKRP